MSNEDYSLPRINNVNKIPTDNEVLEKYIANARQTNYGTLFARIRIFSNIDVHLMRMQELTKSWLMSEKITLEYNPLLTTVPANVGYLYKVCPREENILENKYGCFNRNRCFIMMVKADKDDITEINDALNDLHESTSIKYLSWIEYMGLNVSQKLYLINQQTEHMATYRSLVMTGFCDDDDDIPMIYHEDDAMKENDAPTDPLEKIGVTEYLSTRIKTGKGKLMFHFVYPPIKGVREVTVFHEHVTEALTFIKCSIGEMARIMNKLAIEHVFKDPVDAARRAENKPWQAFRNTSLIPESITAPLMTTPRNKRLRYDHPKRTSYALVARNLNHHNSINTGMTTPTV